MTRAQASYLAPRREEFAVVTVIGMSHVVFENLDFVDAWPSAIHAEGAQHVTVKDCVSRGGQFFLSLGRATRRDGVAEGACARCADITLENCA